MKKETKEKIIDSVTDVTSGLTGLVVSFGIITVPTGLFAATFKSKLIKTLLALGAGVAGGFTTVYVADKVEESNRELITDIVELLDRRKEEVTKITEVEE